MTALLVPFRFDEDSARDRAWRYVRSYYQHTHSGMTVTVGTCHPKEPWSKGVAVRRAFDRTKDDVLVVADADVLVPPDCLAECVETVQAGTPWAQPHGRVYRLSHVQSAHAMESLTPRISELSTEALERRSHACVPGGGIVVVSRDAFETVRGIDPRFVGWGGDDISFARALDTLCGEGVHLAGAMWHLWHPRAPRRRGNRASEASEELAARYLRASGNVADMNVLVGEVDW